MFYKIIFSLQTFKLEHLYPNHMYANACRLRNTAKGPRPGCKRRSREGPKGGTRPILEPPWCVIFLIFLVSDDFGIRAVCVYRVRPASDATDVTFLELVIGRPPTGVVHYPRVWRSRPGISVGMRLRIYTYTGRRYRGRSSGTRRRRHRRHPSSAMGMPSEFREGSLYTCEHVIRMHAILFIHARVSPYAYVVYGTRRLDGPGVMVIVVLFSHFFSLSPDAARLSAGDDTATQFGSGSDAADDDDDNNTTGHRRGQD